MHFGPCSAGVEAPPSMKTHSTQPGLLSSSLPLPWEFVSLVYSELHCQDTTLPLKVLGKNIIPLGQENLGKMILSTHVQGSLLGVKSIQEG